MNLIYFTERHKLKYNKLKDWHLTFFIIIPCFYYFFFVGGGRGVACTGHKSLTFINEFQGNCLSRIYMTETQLRLEHFTVT